MKLLSAIILLCSVKVLIGQTIECSLLNAALETETAEKHLKINTLDSTLVIYDPSNTFNGCDGLTVNGAMVSISRDTIYQVVNPNAHHAMSNNRHLLVAYCLQKDEKQYKLVIWQPYTNINLHFTFRVSNKEIKLIDIEMGVF